MEASVKTKKKKITRDDIIKEYMNYVLEHEKTPVSIYKICKAIRIEESDFYAHFGSVETIQKAIWSVLFDKAMEVINKSPEYESFGKKEKLLTFYYTLFEMLTLNRSYVLFSLTNHEYLLSGLAQLSGMRHKFQQYISQLNDFSEAAKLGVKRLASRTVEEGAWTQFLIILRFWMKDDSPGFEKTDVMIEKSINTTFELAQINPVRSIIDLGKFLIKERVGR